MIYMCGPMTSDVKWGKQARVGRMYGLSDPTDHRIAVESIGNVRRATTAMTSDEEQAQCTGNISTAIFYPVSAARMARGSGCGFMVLQGFLSTMRQSCLPFLAGTTIAEEAAAMISERAAE